jgi:DnaK suppressor protein
MDQARARQLLAFARKRVEHALAGVEPEDGDELADLDQHLADYATDLYETELDESLAAAMREELEAIKRAEQRLDQGRYGLSIESGEPIPDARLEAIPWAERTAEEQARYERSP